MVYILYHLKIFEIIFKILKCVLTEQLRSGELIWEKCGTNYHWSIQIWQSEGCQESEKGQEQRGGQHKTGTDLLSFVLWV